MTFIEFQESPAHVVSIHLFLRNLKAHSTILELLSLSFNHWVLGVICALNTIHTIPLDIFISGCFVIILITKCMCKQSKRSLCGGDKCGGFQK